MPITSPGPTISTRWACDCSSAPPTFVFSRTAIEPRSPPAAGSVSIAVARPVRYQDRNV